MRFSAIVLMNVLSLSLLSTCNQPPPPEPPKAAVAYDSIRNLMAPAVKSGTVLTFAAQIEWKPKSANPCASMSYDDSTVTTTCIVKQFQPGFYKVRYDCIKPNCDPEVIIDETGGKGGVGAKAAAATREIPTDIVTMYCGDDNKPALDQSLQPVQPGQFIRWTSDPNPAELKQWKVAITGADADKWCKDGTTSFQEDADNNTNTCTVSAGAPGASLPFDVTYTAGQCTETAHWTVMIKK